jgi:glycosyltransferase involved in cell wall biosynthesis
MSERASESVPPRATSADNLAGLAGQRAVFLNWRDPTHPAAGGAEVYCWEIAARWAAAGADVTLLTAAAPGRPPYEVVGGVHIYRAGGRFSVYPRTLARLASRFRNADIVVDMQNGIPFFAPLVTGRRTAVVLVVHHVHQDQFARAMSWPGSAVGPLLEGPLSRRVYGTRSVVAVSPSTRAGVRRRLGIGGPIFVVPNGTPVVPATAAHRSPTPRLVAVGRLAPHKRLDLAIQACAALRERYPELRLDIVGDGPERASLTAMAAALGLTGVVRLHGRLDELAKADQLAAAWLHLQPSQAEGWGITVLEAAAHGVPSLAFDVPGLRDSIRPGRTGWLLRPEDQLSDGIDAALRTLADPATAAGVAASCRVWAGSFSWQESADRLAGVALAEQATRQRLLRGLAEQRISDTGCVVRLEGLVEADVTRLRRVLRRTDVIRVCPQERRARILLYGCDERSATQVIERAGIRAGGEVRISYTCAGSEDLLAAGFDHAGIAR